MSVPASRLLTGLAVAAFAYAGFALAQTAAPRPAAAAKPAADPRVALAAKFETRVEAVRATPVPGVYEVSEGTEVLYVSADGRYMLAGDLFDLQTKNNLTEARRKGVRKALLDGVRDADAIVFAPPAPKHELVVFTDIDCGYCRRLHAQMPELNRLGVRVRYLFYPRTGPNTESWRKAEGVWCATNRREALTQAKAGGEVVARTCKSPLNAQWKLGHDMGIGGTPTLYTPDGDEIRNGPPAEILKQLEQLGS
jgi:thiol:disulfide interchange protein DsbC